MVIYYNCILDVLGYLYDALQKQCLVEKWLYLNHISDKKANF